jgi:hypothetical protein
MTKAEHKALRGMLADAASRVDLAWDAIKREPLAPFTLQNDAIAAARAVENLRESFDRYADIIRK